MMQQPSVFFLTLPPDWTMRLMPCPALHAACALETGRMLGYRVSLVRV